MQPFLVAQTPRAGKWNHCFLVPPYPVQARQEVADWVELARLSGCGHDYLAAQSSERQEHGSGASRMGREVLVLAGVAVARLTPEARAAVERFLESRLADLAVLVTRGIDWNAYSDNPGVLTRPELERWFAEGFPRGLPVSPPLRPRGPWSLPPARRWPLALGGVALVLTIMVVLALTAWEWVDGKLGANQQPTNNRGASQSATNTNKNAVAPREKSTKSKDVYDRMKSYVEVDREGDVKALEAALARCANLRVNDKLLDSKEVQRLLEQFEAALPTKDSKELPCPWLFVGPNQELLESYFGEDLSADTIKQKKEMLQTLGKAMRVFHERLQSRGLDKLQDKNNKPYFRMLCRLATSPDYDLRPRLQEVDFQKLNFPWPTEDDAAIIGNLDRITKAANADPKLPWSIDSNDKRRFAKMARKATEAISKVDEERSTVTRSENENGDEFDICYCIFNNLLREIRDACGDFLAKRK